MVAISSRCVQNSFFFNDPATTEIYTLSLHDALPIWSSVPTSTRDVDRVILTLPSTVVPHRTTRSEEHTSELQSQFHLVCRLLLEKKKHNDTHALLAKKKINN